MLLIFSMYLARKVEQMWGGGRLRGLVKLCTLDVMKVGDDMPECECQLARKARACTGCIQDS